MGKLSYVLFFSALHLSCSESEQSGESRQDVMPLAAVKIGDKWGFIDKAGEPFN